MDDSKLYRDNERTCTCRQRLNMTSSQPVCVYDLDGGRSGVVGGRYVCCLGGVHGKRMSNRWVGFESAAGLRSLVEEQRCVMG